MAKPRGKSTSHLSLASPTAGRSRTSGRTLAAERSSPRRVARVTGSDSDDVAALKARIEDLEARNAILADRLAWAVDKLQTIIDDLKAGGSK